MHPYIHRLRMFLYVSILSDTPVSGINDAAHMASMTTGTTETTSSLERYLAEISDPVLRENLAREIGGLKREFGLVFERHHPEGIRLPKHAVKRGSKVVISGAKDSVFYRVHRLNREAGTAITVDADGNQSEHPVSSLTVAKEFGDVMYPGLRKLSEIRRGDPDAPVHTIINGENYHALEALQYTHAGKVDLIYIDPPYNTGNADWKYNDRYVDANDGYKNSKWLSFMEKRLLIAKSLLSRSGMVFISIDDREHARLKLLCDQVFGVSNFVANFVWRTDGKFDNQAAVKSNHEYVLMYSSDAKSLTLGSVVDPNISPESKLHTNTIRNSIVKNGPKNPVSSINLPTGFPAAFDAGVIAPKAGYWPQYSEPAHVKNGRLVNPVTITSGWANANLLRKFIADDFKEIVDGKGQNTRFQLAHTGAVENVKTRRADVQHILTVLYNLGSTEKSGNELKAMGLNFPYPKPVDLIKYLVSFALPDAVILDFFGGSGTTAEAVIRLNSEDGGTRQSILVTNNELSKADDTRLRNSGHAPGDFDFEALGVFNHVTKPRLETVVNGVRRDGSRHSDGLDANIAFFELTYLDEPDIVRGAAFDDLSGLFWLKAGGLGGTVELTAGAKADGFAISVSGRTAVLFTPGRAQALAEKLAATEHAISYLFIVTDSEAQGDEAATHFPGGITVERIYGSYLEAFQVNRKD